MRAQVVWRSVYTDTGHGRFRAELPWPEGMNPQEAVASWGYGSAPVCQIEGDKGLVVAVFEWVGGVTGLAPGSFWTDDGGAARYAVIENVDVPVFGRRGLLRHERELRVVLVPDLARLARRLGKYMLDEDITVSWSKPLSLTERGEWQSMLDEETAFGRRYRTKVYVVGGGT